MFPFLLFLALFNRFIYKSNLNPIFLQSVLWLIYYTILYLNIKAYDIHLYQISQFIIYQSIGFSLGGFFCFLFTRKSSFLNIYPINEKTINLSQANIQKIFPVFFVLQLISLVAFIKSTGNVSILAIADVRDVLAEEDGKNFGSFGLIQMVMAVFLLLISISKTKFTVWHKVLVGLFLYYTMLLGSRGQFVYYFVSLLYILLWQRRISGKKIFVSVSLVLLLMYILTVIRSAKATGQTLGETLLVYTVTSLPALHIGTFVNSKCFGYYTFRVAYIWINKLGFSFPLSSVLSEFSFTPLPTNVYSYVKPYYLDFGYAGVFLLPLFLGILHQYFYFKARRGSFLSLFLSSILMFPLLMQVFEENYFRQLSNIVYSILLAAIVSKLSIRIHKNINNQLNPSAEFN